MKYKTFSGKAFFSETKRNRSVSLKASSFEKAKETLLSTGYTEPIEIQETTGEPPTERQLAYAKSLGIKIEKGIDKEDISILISRVLDKYESDPNPGLIEYADTKELDFSPYLGKKALYNLIFNSLDNRDKIAFFAYSIYRYLSDDRHANLETSPHRTVFYDFAGSKIDDQSFIDSMNRYSGEDLRFFGKMTIKKADGYEIDYSGGSISTIAYKDTASFLSTHFNLPKTKTKVIHVGSNSTQTQTPNPNPNQTIQKTSAKQTKLGCLTGLMMMVTLLVVVSLL